MGPLSADELEALADELGVTVADAETDELVDTVNGFLDGLDAVDEVAVADDGPGGERTWREPTDDPYNAVSYECHVEPAPDNSGALAGVEVGLKDIIAVAGVPMECGSEVMAGYTPRTDATVVRRFRDAGATVTAKLELDEFAGSGRGTTGRGPPVRNPHDPERTAGGSSGGSAVAVATDRVDVSLGTDTGGSVRIPAGFCGVVGLKPTYGLVPLSGVVENTYTQDHVGVFADETAPVAAALDAIAGTDPDDPASLAAAGRDDYECGGYESAVEDGDSGLDSLEIGVLEEGFGEGVADRVAERTRAALDRLADAGATVREVSVDGFEYGPAVKNLLSLTELAVHWRDGAAPYRRGGVVDDGYQAAFAARTRASSGALDTFYKAKLLAGAHVVETHGGRRYTRAQAVREVLREEFDAALDGVDALALPTMPDVAPRVEAADDPGFDYARNTRAANVTRLPAVSLPNGTVDRLPVGFQLMGEAFGERELLGAAAAVEPHLG